MRNSPAIVAFFLCTTLAWPTAVRADRIKVVVLDLVIEGDAPPELKRVLRESLVEGLVAAGYDVTSDKEMHRKLRTAPELVGCVTSTCLARMNALLGAKYFVRAKIEAQGAAYSFDIELFGSEAEAGAVNRVESSCAVCTLAEANTMMRDIARKIPDAPAAKKIPCVVETSPPGATVYVDENEQGKSPVAIELAEGDYTFRATLPDGYGPAEIRTAVTEPADGGTFTVVLTLTPATKVAPPRPKMRFGAWKHAALGVAIAGVGAGATLLWLDGQEAGTCFDNGPRICEKVYDTKLVGLGVIGGGAVLGALAMYMYVADRPIRERTTAITVLPTSRGAALFVLGRF